MLGQSLPKIYEDLLPEDFLSLNPNEKIATCGDCYKIKKTAPAPRFNEKLKCCTYYPFLPNYLLGGLLLDKSFPLGTKVVREFIRDRQYVLPIGLCAPPGYQALFRAKQPEDFGNRFDLVCPFYDSKTQGCGVWAYRGHECATYFCVSSYKNGSEFWTGAREYLHHVEMTLSQQCMLEKGYLLDEIEQCLDYVRRESDDKARDWQLDAVRWSKYWAHHMESIEKYLISTFEFVISNKGELKQILNENRPSAQSSDPRFLKSLLMGGEVSENHKSRS